MPPPPSPPACAVRLDWGPEGLAALLPESDVVVVVDVLSFSTCVDVALARGVTVFPFAARGDEAAAFARAIGAEYAGPRGVARYSLSPAAFETAPAGARVLLPSPNGGSLALRAGAVPTLTAGLRNAAAVARAARGIGTRVAVVPAGERWPSGALRPALEDLLGAGAVVAALGGGESPEAAAPHLEAALLDCVSGRELIGGGYRGDVLAAAELDVSRAVPVLRDGALVDAARPPGAGPP